MHHRTALVASLAAAAASTVRASTLRDSTSLSARSSDPELDLFLRARENGCTGHSHGGGLAKRQEGGEVGGPTTSAEALNYHCDADRCKLPNCHCASRDPPGGLSRDQVPMFVLFTADDAIQRYTLDAVNSVLGGRHNPNGCPVTMTYYNSISYTNFSMVTEWYVAGNEIADHTMTHVGDAPSDEIVGNAAALNAFAGIPQSSLQGFRAPFLNYSNAMLQRLASAQFLYDSSATSTIPVTEQDNDAWWPYTLDYGLANDCLSQKCGDSGPKIPGMWEVPMYAIFDERGIAGAHMMDPWLDAEASGNMTASLDWMLNAFNDHYQRGTRQPFGIYTHPTHFANGIPGQPSKPEIPRIINRFLDYAQQQNDVWIVTTAQLVAWMRNPVPASQLNTLPEFQCQTPQVDQAICNGIPQNEAGLLSHCTFEDFPWHTCYGCPKTQPNPNLPVPEQDVPDGQQARFRLPANCSTPFWDPIGGKCLCTSDACKFTDVTKPIGPNGSNLTSGGTGVGNDSDNGKPEDPYKPFNDDGAMSVGVAVGAVVLAVLGWAVAL